MVCLHFTPGISTINFSGRPQVTRVSLCSAHTFFVVLLCVLLPSCCCPPVFLALQLFFFKSNLKSSIEWIFEAFSSRSHLHSRTFIWHSIVLQESRMRARTSSNAPGPETSVFRFSPLDEGCYHLVSKHGYEKQPFLIGNDLSMGFQYLCWFTRGTVNLMSATSPPPPAPPCYLPDLNRKLVECQQECQKICQTELQAPPQSGTRRTSIGGGGRGWQDNCGEIWVYNPVVDSI